MTTIVALAVQTVLVVPMTADAVRFGVPVRAADLASGLRLSGPGRLQWRRLPVGGARADPVWIELAIAGAGSTARIVAGGDGPSTPEGGPVYAREVVARPHEFGTETVTRWHWVGGATDERVRVEFRRAGELDGECYGAGEARTRARPALGERAVVATELARRPYEVAAVLPPAGRPGLGAARGLRRHLLAVERRLVELPGERGAGDFARGDGTVTNNEFDTALGLLRLGLATGSATAFARGVRCAWHLRDRDLDPHTGLPFPHGPEHRTGEPVAGHAWLHGLLLAGLLTADDELILAGRALARGLAARPPIGRGRNDRARDFAWPLLELEALLAVDPDPLLAAAADRLARAIDARFEAGARTFRFGEGEVDPGVYLERAWLTGGLVLPALRRHLRRRPDAAIAAHVETVGQALLERIGSARGGLPTHWRIAGGRVFAEHRVERDPRALLLLEGLPERELRRLLRREECRASVAETPNPDDPDLPTSFAIAARCSWLYR